MPFVDTKNACAFHLTKLKSRATSNILKPFLDLEDAQGKGAFLFRLV